MIFISHSMMVFKQESSFLIFQKYLKKNGTRVFSKSWIKMVYQVTFKGYHRIFLSVKTRIFLWQKKSVITFKGYHDIPLDRPCHELMLKKGSPWTLSCTIILSDLYQWLNCYLKFTSKIIYGWHLSTICCLKQKLSSKRSEQQFSENKWLGFSTKNEI